MKKNIAVLGLMLWVIFGCGLHAGLSPEEIDLFTGYNELNISQIEPGYGTQMPERYYSQLKEVIMATAMDQNLFQRINVSPELNEGESPAPEKAGQPENKPPATTEPPGKVMVLQIRINNFKPVPPEMEISRSSSMGSLSVTCNFLDEATGKVLDQADFGNISERNRGVESTELMVNRVGRDVVKYISQRKNSKPNTAPAPNPNSNITSNTKQTSGISHCCISWNK